MQLGLDIISFFWCYIFSIINYWFFERYFLNIQMK